MDGSTRYLLMADSQGDADRLGAALTTARPDSDEFVRVTNLFDAASALRQGNIAAVLLEAGFSACRPGDILNLLAGTAADTPLIVLADSGQLPAAMQAVRRGADDYILKPAADDHAFRHRLRFCAERFREARRSRRSLRESESRMARFETLVHDNGDAMLVLDTSGRIKFANAAAGDLFKCSPASLLGSDPGFPAGEGHAMEFAIDRHRGGDTVAELRLSRTSWDGEPAVLATLRDISLRKRGERALALAKQQAELANEMKSRFLANMSHELRTPLNSILGFTELMQQGIFGKIDNPRYEDYLSTIRHSGRHLLTLINNLLDLSKIEAGREELCEEVVDIRALLHAAAHAEEPTAREHGLTLRCDVGGQAQLLRADPVKLDQIVFNLLSNAIKFTPDGGRVTLTGAVTAAGEYRITVADTGCGMNEDDIPQAMGLFTQVRSPYVRSRDRGTGLGLPIARSLAELHGGRLEIASRRGSGTKVSVTLPAQRIQGTPLSKMAAISPQGKSTAGRVSRGAAASGQAVEKRP